MQEILVATWQVLASLIGIAFVIIVFLTQYVVDRKFEKRALPLFASRTWMVFTVMMGLLTLLGMGINVLLFEMLSHPENNPKGFISEFVVSLSLYNLVLFAVNIFLTIRLYIVTYKLLSPNYFQDEFRKYLQKLVNKGVQLEFRNRISKKLILDQGNQSGINISSFDSYPNKTPVVLPGLSRTISEIIDVNLCLLHLVSKRTRKTLVGQASDGVVFLGELGRRVSVERPQIAFVPSGFGIGQITYPLQKAVRLALVADRRRSDLGNEMLLNRDMMAAAIRNGISDEVEQLLDNYLETLRAFLKSFNDIGLRYNFDMAHKEISVFSDWPFISTISEQYIYLLDLALKSDDSLILHHFVGFPFHVMSLAFSEKDHLLFRRFSNLYYVMYVRSSRIMENQDLRHYVKDRSWRLLVDFDKYQIAHAIENSATLHQNKERLTDYSVQILVVLNRLLKSSIDQQDWEQYQLYGSAMRHIYKNVDGKYTSDHLVIFDMQRDQYRGQEIPEAFQQEYQHAREIIKQKDRLENTRRVFIMGIGAWLIHLYETDRLTSSDLFEHLLSVDAEFLSADVLYDVYCNYLSADKVHNLTDWTSWELEEKPETPGVSTFSALAFDTWLARYYTIRMIALMPTNEDMAPPELKPNINSDSTSDTIVSQLTHLEDTPIWQDYLQVNKSTYEHRKKVLIQIHQTAVDQQKTLDEIEIAHKPLDQEKIKNFFENVEKSWLETSTLRTLFVYYKKYKPRPDAEPPEDLLAYGVNRLDEKGAYVQQNRVGYPDWGGSYGRSLGNSEDAILSANLLSLESISIQDNELATSISENLKKMKSLGYSPIILCERSLLFGSIYKLSNFQARWRTQNELGELLNAQGLYDDTLVFPIWSMSKKTIVLIDLKSFATLVQYRPTDGKDFPLHILIEEISDERAKEILVKNPDWSMHPKTEEKLSEEASIRRIQQHVHVQILERFRLEDIDKKAGRLLRVLDETNDTSDRE